MTADKNGVFLEESKDGILKIKSMVFGWVMSCILWFVLPCVLFVMDDCIIQPHTTYATGTWFSLAIPGALHWSCWVAAGMAIIFPFGVAIQKSPADVAYYPRLQNFPAMFRSLFPRMVVTWGVLLLAGYWVYTAIDVLEASHRAHGLLWPPHYFFVIGMMLWGVLWIADCLTRPRYGSILAAVLFTAWIAVSTLPIAFGVMRE